jgi:hypothetical protein
MPIVTLNQHRYESGLELVCNFLISQDYLNQERHFQIFFQSRSLCSYTLDKFRNQLLARNLRYYILYLR